MDDLPPPSVDELVQHWHQRREQGETLSLHELCAGAPEKVDELRQHLQAVAAMESFLGVNRSGSERTLAAPPSGVNGAGPPPAGLPTAPPGYEIVGELGRGAMGVVYQARQVGLNRPVALKMVLAGRHASERDLARFRSEAEAVARVQHPNIVQVHEIGEHQGIPFFSLEYCPGGNLDRKLSGQPLAPPEATRLVEALARAVQAAHDQAVIHRDLKPSNVLLAADGTPKVSDFGLAKRLNESGQTASGAILGTPSYMAPEQALGQNAAVGPAADVYALGAILYECLTGRPPFRAATTMDTLAQVVRQEPVSLRHLNAGVPRDLETVCLRCLQKEPARRYESARALAEDLERYRKGEPVRARPVGALERGRRWCRRNPVVAGSLLAVALSLLLGSVVSVVFGVRAEQARRDESARARSESAARQEADQARHEAQRQLIDLCVSSAMMATRENDHPLALLWFARAVQLARDEPQQEELNRIRVANWLRQVCLPEGTFTVPGFRQGHDHVRTLRFSPDGRYVLVVGGPGGCRVWDRLGGRPVRLPEPAARGPAAAWQPESGLLAVAYGDGRIRFLAPPEFQPTGEAISAGEVTVLAFSRDGRSLAWGGPGGARVWDVGKKEYLTPLLAHPAPVATVSFSAAGDRLATSARDLKARVFRVDREDREPLFPPVSHWLGEYSDLTPDEPGRAAPQFVAGDQVLLTVEKTAQGPFALIRRSALTGQRLSSSGAPAGVEYLVACAASPQGDQAAVLWGDAARLLDTSTGKMLLALPRGRARFENATFSADGKTLVTCGSDGGLRFWPVDDLPEDFRLPTFTSPVWNPLPTARVELTSDGRHVAVAHWDGRVCLWQLPEGPPASYSLPSGWGTLTALSPDGRLVLPRGMSFRNGALLSTQAYHADSGRAAGPRLDPGGVLLDAAFSPDGARVATASSTGRNPTERNQRVFRPEGKGGNVQLWDWKTGKRLVGPIPTPGEPRGLAFHPDGHTLAVVCADYRVLVVDPGTGTVVNNLDPGVRTRRWGNANQWWSNGEARFSPDGRFLVTWEMSSHVHVWDPERGQLLHTLSHGERVGHVCFHPTVPTLLATGSWDRSARVWDLTTGKLLVQIKHPQWVTRVRFSPDGRDLITSCGDGMLRVWDWDSGKLKDGLLLQSYLLQDFGFTRDRRWLISLGAGEFQVTDWQTRTPVGPLWNLKPRFNLELAIPGDGRRAIVGAFADSLVGYDLEKMVTPVSGPAEDLVQLAELAAGRRILSAGRVVPLTSAEWADRWQRVRRDFPTGWPSTTTALPPSP